MYRFDLLLPSRHPGAFEHNAARLGPDTFGIEVTEPELAAGCELGHLDPQHDPHGDGRAAIEAALEIPPPPAGARLVTLRPDADALGAMALLWLRLAGRPVDPPMRERVMRIARADRFDHGPWPGPRRWPPTREEVRALVAPDTEVSALAALAAAHDRPLAQRVAAIRRWLERGELEPLWRERVEVRVETLVRALAADAVAVEPRAGGRIALVRSAVPGTLRLGYLLAPVVVAEARAPDAPAGGLRKLSISQYDTTHLDLRAVARELARREPGWGGSDTIVGSPQGRGSALPLDVVLGVVTRHLRRRA